MHSTYSALRLAPIEFAREMRIVAVVQWYAQGIVSEGVAAELAGLIRSEMRDPRDARYSTVADRPSQRL